MEKNKIAVKPAGIYMDFPFCIARCAFCAFNVQGYREGLAKRYLQALQKEIALYTEAGRDFKIVSLYLGGGTPTSYPAETLNEIVGACYGAFVIEEKAEITVEAHPATINTAYLKAIRAGGVNRLSIGVQSFSDAQLIRLNRHHTVYDIYHAFDAAREAGFCNIGIDLIYALPDQSLQEWEETLQAAITLKPEHLSIYGLSIEKGALFYKQGVTLPPEENQIAMYRLAQERLAESAYQQYEISNFAQPGCASLHNLLYWNRGETLGIGLSAHGYWNHEHHVNTDSLITYMEQVEAGHFPSVSFVCNEEEERGDQIIFGLRKTEGIPHAWLEPFCETVLSFMDEGLLISQEDRIKLTPQGMLMADAVAVALL